MTVEEGAVSNSLLAFDDSALDLHIPHLSNRCSFPLHSTSGGFSDTSDKSSKEMIIWCHFIMPTWFIKFSIEKREMCAGRLCVSVQCKAKARYSESSRKGSWFPSIYRCQSRILKLAKGEPPGPMPKQGHVSPIRPMPVCYAISNEF